MAFFRLACNYNTASFVALQLDFAYNFITSYLVFNVIVEQEYIRTRTSKKHNFTQWNGISQKYWYKRSGNL